MAKARPARRQSGAASVRPESIEPSREGATRVEEGIADLAGMAPEPTEPRNLGNFDPEGSAAPAPRRERKPQHLPTVEDQRLERQLQGQPEPQRRAPRDTPELEDFDDLEPRDEELPRGAAAGSRERVPTPDEVFPDDERHDQGERETQPVRSDDAHRIILEQNERIRQLEGLAAGRVSGGASEAGGVARAVEPWSNERMVQAIRTLPYSINEATCEQLGIRPEAANLLMEMQRQTAQHALTIGIAIAAQEIQRLERRFDEFAPVQKTVEQQEVQRAFYGANPDLVGFEQESAWIWDDLAKRYPSATKQDLLRAVPEETRRHLRARGINTADRRQAPAAPAPSGYRDERRPMAARPRPAASDGGGGGGGGGGRGARGNLSPVQQGIAELAAVRFTH